MVDFKSAGSYRSSERGPQVGMALTFLFIGLGIGALSALLFAPHSGEKTRRRLRRKYEDAVDSVEDWADQAGDMWERGKDSVSDLRDRSSDFARKAADRVSPVTRVLRRD